MSRQTEYSRRERNADADIGPIRQVVNPIRKAFQRDDLLFFLVQYFPETTGLRPFSEDHLRVIARMQSCILTGGRFVNAVYRGFAKTTITENAALWATLNGHKAMLPVFGASDPMAKEMIKSIKRELQENDLLDEDFPEVTQAVRHLEGKPQRCASQTCRGAQTFIEWNADKIVFPTIVGSVCSSAIIVSRGIEAGARGLKHKTPTGKNQRPDFALIDDFQTDESAKSPLQNKSRLDVIRKSILKMAGHRNPISCVINGTPIAPDDAIEELLDQKKSPAWQSERIPMVRKWADAHDTFWEKYRAIRENFNPEIVGDQNRAKLLCNDFYAANREAMDAGCVVSWEWCFNEDVGNATEIPEYSAIQHAYNMLFDDGADVFASECQVRPLRIMVEGNPAATATQIAAKQINLPRGSLPAAMERVTAFIDVQGKLLYWLAVAWREDFTGHVIDYGCYPDQGRDYYSLSDAKRTMRMLHGGAAGDEGILYAALGAITSDLLSRKFTRPDGASMPIERLVIDANWSTNTVYDFCGESKFSAIITPSHGRFFGASTQRTIAEYVLDPGETRGPGWLLTRGKAARKTRHLLIDTNFWKSFVHRRLTTALGDKGSLSLFKSPDNHRLLCDHLTSEAGELKEKVRKIEEWSLKRTNADNHWLDCLVGAAVAASIQGCRLTGKSRPATTARPSLGQMRAATRRGA